MRVTSADRRGATPRQALIAVALLLAIYFGMLWPWMLRWGATDAELSMALPGDELATSVDYRSTRAVTIHAPADEVWQWIVQMGQDRAAFYSYDWLENLVAADHHNADQIKPEWQELHTGDLVRGAPPDFLGGRLGSDLGWRVVVLEPGRSLYLWGPIVIRPIDDTTTRLIVRTPEHPGSAIGWATTVLLYDPAHFVMERRMLLGIKMLAEGGPATTLFDRVGISGWILASIGTLAVLAERSRSRLEGFLPIAYGGMILGLTGDLRAAVAGFLIVGLPMAGFLAYGRRWWPSFVLLAATVLLVLLLADDAYPVFGICFLAGFALLTIESLTSRRRLTTN